MQVKPVPIWKEAPFLRLILSFTLGITAQWYLQLSINVSLVIFAVLILFYLLFQFSKRFFQFKLYWLNGVFINSFLFLIGVLLTYRADISHRYNFIKNFYKKGDLIIATLQEPLSEKEKSFKALAVVECVGKADSSHAVKDGYLFISKKRATYHHLVTAHK